MPRRSKRDNNNNNNNDQAAVAPPAAAANDDDDVAPPQPPRGNSVSAAVRQRQREVAEREASRLARPEKRRTKVLAHADRKKSGVTSTPFGVLYKTSAADDDSDVDNEEWCGPFSIAKQLIRKREDAKRKREEEEAQQQREHHPLDGAMQELEQLEERKQHPSLLWKSNLQKGDQNNNGASLYAKRQKRVDVAKEGTRIPKLFELCIGFIVENFEYVEAIGDVPNDVRLDIAKQLVSRNQLDDKAFRAMIEPNMEILEVIDCAGISQETMASTLASIQGLRYLLLAHAGRCFGVKAVQEFLKNDSAQLACISVAGAYLLKDEDAATLIERHATTLQSIRFKVCPLLGAKFVQALQLHVATKGNLLELSLEDMTLSTELLETLASCNDVWKNIKSISLQSVTGLTDEILSRILAAAGNSLDSLDVSDNHELGETTLSSIRQFNPRLRTLAMNGNKALTSVGLEAMFTHPLESLPPPPKLKVLKLSSIHHQAVTDEVTRLVTAGASSQEASNDDSAATSYTGVRKAVGGGLVQLDIQGSTLVTDTMLEQLVETSANTMESLNISCCPSITDNGLGYLLSKAGNQLTSIQVWGCAQLTENFFDGHDRVNDRTLQIEGAWMKKSGTSSLR